MSSTLEMFDEHVTCAFIFVVVVMFPLWGKKNVDFFSLCSFVKAFSSHCDEGIVFSQYD